MANQKNSSEESEKASSAAFVKVSMDGAPYLRKVDLKMYKSYQELSDALAKMFSSFTMGKYTVPLDKIHHPCDYVITHPKTYTLFLKWQVRKF